MKMPRLNEEACTALVFFLSNPTRWTQKRWEIIEWGVRSQKKFKRLNADKRRALHRKPRPHTYKKGLKNATNSARGG